ncbi:MAG: undecaprenyldiphospho-muramoylpentapeptide beta-N-acetylglucosaminyltransferase [Clostridia bacterium]|nr:undecaprenyldiphospho-muramoylpentapeptide beta-N-acetylglucosaminyltransferase [Clostridia bacterium]
MRVIVAAAGTAGHINPGLAIANKIKEKEPDSKIIFIGTTRGLENSLVPREGYELKTIEAYGLSKQISIQNFKKICTTLKATGKARKIIQEFKPDVIIGAGGYICGPVVWAAKKENIPVVLHESNAFPGRAVKFLAKKADKVLISFEEARSRIANAKNIVFTGTPVKIEKRQYTYDEKKSILQNAGLQDNLPTILVFGGSQGAQKINDAIIGILENKLNKEYQIIWATGPKQYNIIKEELSKKNIDIKNIQNAKILPYIYNMEEIMNVSNVIVARSGAMTITEISNLGKPSILVPLPNVSQDHQLHNAKVLENVGAAKIILNNELTKDNLNNQIQDIIKNPQLMNEMGKKALSKSVKNVQEKIYIEINKVIKGC